MESRFVPLPRAASNAAALTPEGFASFTRALHRCDAHLRGFMILRDGAVAAEQFWAPYAPTDMVWVYSISKSFTSTAVGFAVAEGLLSVDDRLVDLFPEKVPAEISPHLAELRLHHLLSMSTGHAEDTALPIFLSGDPDWERVFFSLPLAHAPGTFFCYNSGASYMLAAAVERVTGEGLVEYLTPRLFEPLGFDRVEWDRNPSGTAMGGWGFMLRLEDLAKLGELYRTGGIWNGTRILSEEWVEAASSMQIDNSQRDEPNVDWTQGYGYQFWMCRHGAFRGDGAYGQFCVVMPQQHTVLVLSCETADMQAILDAVWDVLLPELDRVPAEAVAPRQYVLAEAARGFDSVSFGIDDDALLTLAFSGPHGEVSLRAGEGRWVEGASAWPFGAWSALPYFSLQGSAHLVSAHYRRTASDTYEIEWVWRETPHRNRAVVVVGESGIEVTFPARAHSEQMQLADLTMRGSMLS